MSVSTVDTITGIILHLVFALVLATAVAFGIAAVRDHLAQRRVKSAEYWRLRKLCDRRGDVINSVILELDSRPATYETFPSQLRDELSAAHRGAADDEKGKV